MITFPATVVISLPPSYKDICDYIEPAAIILEKAISRLLVTSPKSLLKVIFIGYRDSCSDVGGLITEEKTATFLLMKVVPKKHCLDIGCDAVSEREDRKAPGRR